jgi:hypothetical protein
MRREKPHDDRMAGHERVRSAFDPETYRRLVALKDRYDPDNVFCLNQNIKPGREQSQPVSRIARV